jgi:hypothetical protein
MAGDESQSGRTRAAILARHLLLVKESRIQLYAAGKLDSASPE